MVRALTERWEALGAHPTGRWLKLLLEVLWYLALALAVWRCWDVPQAYFLYFGL